MTENKTWTERLMESADMQTSIPTQKEEHSQQVALGLFILILVVLFMFLVFSGFFNQVGGTVVVFLFIPIIILTTLIVASLMRFFSK